jgi:hypothetical protein
MMAPDKEMAPRVLQHPGTRPTEKGWLAVDERILAHRAHLYPTDQEYHGSEEPNCFYCLEGWVFLGSLGHDGEEIFEAIRCRKCGGPGRLKSS